MTECAPYFCLARAAWVPCVVTWDEQTDELRCIRSPRDPRKREACSDRCRAALSRERRAEAQAKRDQDIRAHIEAALRWLERTAP